MTTLVAQYPEDLLETLHMTREEFESEARFAMAAKLFELGRLTTGQAAQLVPMSRYDFIHRISELGVAAVSWDAGEAENEFLHAYRLGGCSAIFGNTATTLQQTDPSPCRLE